MTQLLQISLTTNAADSRFGKNPALTPTVDGYQIHQPAQEQLRAIQKAGRSLDGLGVQQVQLAGSDWTIDKQWAFYQGFCSSHYFTFMRLGTLNYKKANKGFGFVYYKCKKIGLFNKDNYWFPIGRNIFHR